MSATPNQIIFAKEVMINLKKIGLALLLSIIVFCALYVTLDWRSSNAGSVYEGYDMNLYHERQKSIFLADMLGKSFWFFIGFSLLLIVLRYVIMAFKWVSRTSKINN